MFLGYGARAVVRVSYRHAECSLAKSWPNQNRRTIPWQFKATFRLGDAQFPIGLNALQAFGPNSRSFSNVQVVYGVTKIRFSPVTRLRNPFITRKERRVNDDNTATLAALPSMSLIPQLHSRSVATGGSARVATGKRRGGAGAHRIGQDLPRFPISVPGLPPKHVPVQP
jgi:hypothetical protein